MIINFPIIEIKIQNDVNKGDLDFNVSFVRKTAINFITNIAVGNISMHHQL